jgi:putative tryptophan/tyrosine transport system substrate-binding protein
MGIGVGRRQFLSALGGAAVAWPCVARAQQAAMPVVGYVSRGTSAGFAPFVGAFRQGLSQTGYVEGRNVTFQYRWAEGQEDRLPALVADLVGRQVAVIAATGGLQPGVVAKAATSTIPIVFTGGGDPVKVGLVASLARPGGNATGATNFSPAVTAKRLELFRQMLPSGRTIAVLSNPTDPNNEVAVREVQDAADATGQPIHIVNASGEHDFDAAFAEIKEYRAAALFVTADPLFTSRRARLVALAEQNAIPASYAFRDFPLAGGLMSYGADLLDVHRQAGVYTGRILKGDRPADLPVMQPTKFEFVINLKTAKTLGLTVPPTLLALADEVIE